MQMRDDLRLDAASVFGLLFFFLLSPSLAVVRIVLRISQAGCGGAADSARVGADERRDVFGWPSFSAVSCSVGGGDVVALAGSGSGVRWRAGAGLPCRTISAWGGLGCFDAPAAVFAGWLEGLGQALGCVPVGEASRSGQAPPGVAMENADDAGRDSAVGRATGEPS